MFHPSLSHQRASSYKLSVEKGRRESGQSPLIQNMLTSYDDFLGDHPGSLLIHSLSSVDICGRASRDRLCGSADKPPIRLNRLPHPSHFPSVACALTPNGRSGAVAPEGVATLVDDPRDISPVSRSQCGHINPVAMA